MQKSEKVDATLNANSKKGDAKTSTPGSKNFQLTLNTPDEQWNSVYAYLAGLHPNYLVACKEKAPSTGHEHIHIYVQFPNIRRLSLKKLKGAHVEKCKGSPEQNEAYIKKDGDVIKEEGEIRRNFKIPTVQQVKKMSKEEIESLPVNLYKCVKNIREEDAKNISIKDYHKEVKVYWLYGASGLGKTRKAIKIIEELGYKEFNEVKFDGSFWHGVTEDNPVAVYDDFRDTHMKPSELINFIDYNKHVLNVKNGSLRNNYNVIIITSIQNPEEIYERCPEEYKKQWLRRIKEIQEFEDITNK